MPRWFYIRWFYIAFDTDIQSLLVRSGHLVSGLVQQGDIKKTSRLHIIYVVNGLSFGMIQQENAKNAS